MRRQEDSGQRQLDNNIMAFRVISYVGHMESLGIKPEEYTKVYEKAVAIYNDEKPYSAFNVDYMIKGAKALQEDRLTYKTYSKPERKAMVSCTTCQGSKLAYKMENGKITGIQKDAKGKFLACPDCKV